MIVSFFAHPVAFLIGALAMLAYMEAMAPPEDSWWPVGIFVVMYLIGYWVLPWWTRPLNLWRYWRSRENTDWMTKVPPSDWTGR